MHQGLICSRHSAGNFGGTLDREAMASLSGKITIQNPPDEVIFVRLLTKIGLRRQNQCRSKRY